MVTPDSSVKLGMMATCCDEIRLKNGFSGCVSTRSALVSYMVSNVILDDYEKERRMRGYWPTIFHGGL